MKKNHSHSMPKGQRRKSENPTDAAWSNFIEYHPTARVSRNLRKMLIDFLMSDGATESTYLQDLLYDLGGLFDLLDCIEAENAKRKKV